MKHLSKWFIAAFTGVALFASSCVDQVKFGDSFLEKAPGVAVTQDTIFGKATYARAFLWDTYSKLYYGLPVYWNTVEGKMNTGIFEMSPIVGIAIQTGTELTGNTIRVLIRLVMRIAAMIHVSGILKRTVGRRFVPHCFLWRM